MNTNDKFVITINRQFGTGGHEVGAELARRLNVKILDRQILKAVADRFETAMLPSPSTRIPCVVPRTIPPKV